MNARTPQSRRAPLPFAPLAALAALAALALALGTAACGYRPPRFADRAPVLTAGDNAPIPVPRRRRGFSADTITDLNLRNVIVDALEPERTPEAGDVNALDEVPRSSWFDPEPAPGATPAAGEGPPELPLTALAPSSVSRDDWPPAAASENLITTLEGTVVAAVDALGRRYVLRRDPPDHPALRTGTEVVAGRLVRALGYLSPRADILEIGAADLAGPPERVRAFLAAGPQPERGRYRVSAVRWPIGVDLGPTLALATRRDDPNDRIPHRDRRTLRALGMVAGWLRWTPLDPEHLRDVYVGPPGRGHVQHHLVGLHTALGAGLIGLLPADGTTLQRVLTLGLTPEPAPIPRKQRWAGVGEIGPLVTERDIDPSPSFAPIDRALPGDHYWAAKRIRSLPAGTLAGAVAAARLPDATAAAHLLTMLEARRAQIAAFAYGRVTPCEVERIAGDTLVLRDLGVEHGLWSAMDSRYRVEQLSEEGNELAPTRWITSADALIDVPLPPPSGYLVLRVQVVRLAGSPAPDPGGLELHLVAGRTSGAAWRVRGVRH